MDNNISNKVFNHIKNNIINKQWKPGDKITSEIQLAKELEVSRITVREAIGRLVAMNILTKKKGGGSFVNTLTPSDYMDDLIPLLMLGDVSYIQILEARIALETSAIGFFIKRASEEEYKDLENAYEEMEKHSKNQEIFFIQDVLFHKILAKGSNNQVICKILDIIFKIMEGQPREDYYKLESEKRIEEHKKILEAVKNKDKKLAEIFLERHLQRTINDLKNEEEI